MKIVINACYGGYGLSDKAIEYYANLKGIQLETKPSRWLTDQKDFYLNGEFFSDRDIARNDPDLIKTVEALGCKECSDWASDLKIVDIPDEVNWQIEEYDGLEWIAEEHRTWD